MGSSSDPLRNLKVASPCPANWDAMYGDDRVRFCGECRLNVYNLSGMTRTEAERLIASREGRLCVRFYRRQDGTVITKDCPVGFAAVRRRVAKVASAFAGFVFGALTGAGATLALGDSSAPAATGHMYQTMGDVAVPPRRSEPPDAVCTTGVVMVPSQGEAVVGMPTRQPPASHPKVVRRGAAR